MAISVIASPWLEAVRSASKDPSAPAQPPLQRGHTYLRIQGPGGNGVYQHPFPAAIKIVGGGMLDDPGRQTRPLFLEQIDYNGKQWVMLERQLSLRTSRQGNGLANIQTLQVLDVHPIPPGGQLLFRVANGAAACSYNGRLDPDLVAFRRFRDRDDQKAVFKDIQLAWRVNRQQLRLQPIDPSSLSCSNPAEGQP